MTEYPKLEFRVREDIKEYVFQVLARREFQEREVTTSSLLKTALQLALPQIESDPDLVHYYMTKQKREKDDNS